MDSFELNIEVFDETKVNMANLLFNIVSHLDLNSVCLEYLKDERRAVKEVNYSCKRGLDGNISDCNLAVHPNCFNEAQISMFYDIDSKSNGGSSQLERLKSCCNHSLRDLCVHNDGAWRKLKSIATKKTLMYV